MPNWCFNTIYFSGDTTKLKTAIADARKRQRESGNGESIIVPEEIHDGYFFDIYFEEDTDIMQYCSRWSPNCQDVAELCKVFNVPAHHEWEEEGNLVFGRANYSSDGKYIEHKIPSKWFDDNVKWPNYDDEIIDVYTYIPTGERFETLLDLIETHYKYPSYLTL
jgi:hypothetical protein